MKIPPPMMPPTTTMVASKAPRSRRRDIGGRVSAGQGRDVEGNGSLEGPVGGEVEPDAHGCEPFAGVAAVHHDVLRLETLPAAGNSAAAPDAPADFSHCERGDHGAPFLSSTAARGGAASMRVRIALRCPATSS